MTARRPNSDEEMRALERAALGGDLSAVRKLAAMRFRRGDGIRSRTPAEVTRAFKHFHGKTGGIVGEAARTALDLARAEHEASKRGWTVEIEPDEYDREFDREAWHYRLVDRKGRTLATLGGVHETDGPYAREVKAELAWQALREHRGGSHRGVAGRKTNPARPSRVHASIDREARHDAAQAARSGFRVRDAVLVAGPWTDGNAGRLMQRVRAPAGVPGKWWLVLTDAGREVVRHEGDLAPAPGSSRVPTLDRLARARSCEGFDLERARRCMGVLAHREGRAAAREARAVKVNPGISGAEDWRPHNKKRPPCPACGKPDDDRPRTRVGKHYVCGECYVRLKGLKPNPLPALLPAAVSGIVGGAAYQFFGAPIVSRVKARLNPARVASNPGALCLTQERAAAVAMKLRRMGHAARVQFRGPSSSYASNRGRGPWQVVAPTASFEEIEQALGMRRQNRPKQRPFGVGEQRIYSQLAERIALGDLKALAMCRRSGLVSAHEIGTFGPHELAARVLERLGEQRAPNPLPGAFIFAIGGNPHACGARAPRSAPPRCANFSLVGEREGEAKVEGKSFRVSLPANRVKGTMTLEALRRKVGDRAVDANVAAFRDFHRADVSEDVILYDDGKPGLTVKWLAGKSPEQTYGGPGGVPPESRKASGGGDGDPDGTLWVHKSKNSYLLGDAVSDDFSIVGSVKSRRGWLRG